MMTVQSLEKIKEITRERGWSGGQWKDRERSIPGHSSTEQGRKVQSRIVPYYPLTSDPDGASQGCWTEDGAVEAVSGGGFGILYLRRDTTIQEIKHNNLKYNHILEVILVPNFRARDSI